MKKISFIILLLVIGTTCTLAQKARIAVVNEQEVLKEYKFAKEVQAQLEAIVKSWQDTLTMMRDSVRKMQEEYNATFDATPIEIRKQKIAGIRDFEDYIDAYGNERGNALDGGLFIKKKDEMYMPVIEKFRKVVAEIAKKEKVDIVYAQANLFVTGDVLDLTQKVIEALK